MTSASFIGRLCALLSVTCAGFAVGTLMERHRSGKSPSGRLTAPLPSTPSALNSHSHPTNPTQSPSHVEDDFFLSKVLHYGLPSDERVRYFNGYVASLNYERRVPNWVLEYLPFLPNPAAPAEASREGMKFFADLDTPEAFRVRPDDYTHSARHPNARGLSRGHLAAAQFHKHGAEEMAQTFNMNANIVPQDMTMNAVDWLRLENLTRTLRRRYAGGLWVITGPVFMPRWVYGSPRHRPNAPLIPISDPTPRATDKCPPLHKMVCYELIGTRDVAVPTHLFKVILGECADGRREVAAFLMPNAPIPVEQPLTYYQVGVGEIERVTGLQFFPRLLTEGVGAWGVGGRGIDALPNICAHTSCEIRPSALFQSFRGVARLRASQSVPELQKVYTELMHEQQRKTNGNGEVKLEAAVVREFMDRKRELVEEAVMEID